MARFALALFAIVVLALSAGFTRTPLQPPSTVAASSFQAIELQKLMLADFAPASRLGRAPTLQRGEEAPAPALIAYLMLVLIGSAVAVCIVRYRERSQR